MPDTSIMNLTHTQTNGSCIIDFSRHRMPHLLSFLEGNLIEMDMMSQQTFFFSPSLTFTSRNPPTQLIQHIPMPSSFASDCSLWPAVSTLTCSAAP